MTLERILYPFIALTATIMTLLVIVWCLAVVIVRKIQRKRMDAVWNRYGQPTNPPGARL